MKPVWIILGLGTIVLGVFLYTASEQVLAPADDLAAPAANSAPAEAVTVSPLEQESKDGLAGTAEEAAEEAAGAIKEAAQGAANTVEDAVSSAVEDVQSGN